MRMLAFIGLVIFFLVLIALPIILFLTGNLFWGGIFSSFLGLFSIMLSLRRLWLGLVKPKGRRVILQAKIHREYRLVSIIIYSIGFFLGFVLLFALSFSPLDWKILIPIIIFVLGLYALLKEVSALEFTEEGIRQFDTFISWDSIWTYSWKGDNFDALSVKIKGAKFNNSREWRIARESGDEVSRIMVGRFFVRPETQA